MARRGVMRAEGAGGFAALWGAISRLSRGKTLDHPLDRLREAPTPARTPLRRLVGGMFRPGQYPVLIGPGRCAQKGHRGGASRPERVQYDYGRWCSRCFPGWDQGFHYREGER